MYNFRSDYVIAVLIGAILSFIFKLYIQAITSYNDYHNIPILSNWFTRYFFSFFCICLTFTLLPIMLILSIILFIYRGIIYIILKLTYWKTFKGFVSGRDVIWLLKDRSQPVVMSMLVIQGKDECSKNVVESIKTSILDALKFNVIEDFKVFLSFKKKLGYFISLNEKYDVANFISVFDTDDPNQEYLTHEELERKLSEFGSRPMPYNNSKYMEILISKKPIQWKAKDDKESYLIILRIHHSLGDGISISRILTESFRSDKFDIITHKIQETINNEPNGKFTSEKFNKNKDTVNKKQKENFKSRTFIESIKSSAKEYGKIVISFIIFVFFITNSFIVQRILKPMDKNPLHGPVLKGEKLYLSKTEDQQDLVELTKKLKHKVPGSYFVDFVITALSASFHEYFEKKTSKLPKYLTGVVPARVDFKEIQIDRGQKFQFTNNFTVALFHIPVELSDKENKQGNQSLVARLRDVIKQTHKLRKSFDFYINFWGLTVFSTLIPVPFLWYILNIKEYTTFISCLPGPEALHVLDHYPLRDIVFWLPTKGQVGVGFSCFTYDKKFQFGLVVDKALYNENDNLQEILDNISKYLRLLGDELTKEIIL